MIDWPNVGRPYVGVNQSSLEAPASIKNLSPREQYRVTKDITKK